MHKNKATKKLKNINLIYPPRLKQTINITPRLQRKGQGQAQKIQLGSFLTRFLYMQTN